jgi:hypothetical protein
MTAFGKIRNFGPYTVKIISCAVNQDMRGLTEEGSRMGSKVAVR